MIIQIFSLQLLSKNPVMYKSIVFTQYERMYIIAKETTRSSIPNKVYNPISAVLQSLESLGISF